MSSGGVQKWLKGAMGWPEVAGNFRKITKFPVTHGGRRRRLFADPIPARSAVVRRETSPAVASGCAMSPRPACVAYGWQEVRPLVQSFTARKWPNGPTLCSQFGELFPRVLELKRVFWGIGFHLAS